MFSPDITIDRITDIYHPNYKANSIYWQKWRLCYNSGDPFILRYLQRFPDREDRRDFEFRRIMSYVPAFAKAAVNDIKNAIYQRITDINRENGPFSYQACVEGLLGGVDLMGSSMSFYVGQKILPELLSMSKVGVFVDMPQLDGDTLADKGSKRPYLYYYPIEDIRAWSYCQQHEDPNEFDAIILRDNLFKKDESGLPIAEESVYRHVWKYNNEVYTRYYDAEGRPGEVIKLGINKIPFVVLEINDSLLTDVSNYQIALMNLASSDMYYALMGNYPFYTEQYDPRNENVYGATAIVNADRKPENTVRVGVNKGRRYPINTERPSFIVPPSEPLKVSMEKQQQLKEEIYTLVNLSVANVAPVRYIAKNQNNQGLEAGLSYIGLVLENAERKIGEYWALYENASAPYIQYPNNYALIDNETIIKENEQDIALADKVSSKSFKKQLLLRVAKRTVGGRISSETLKEIEDEIYSASVVIGDVASITQDVTNGLVSNETASIARGYPKDEADKAKIDHAERLARIQEAQTPHNTGVADTNIDPNAGKLEKIGTETRGNGKFNN